MRSAGVLEPCTCLWQMQLSSLPPAETSARHWAWDPEPRVAEAQGVLPGPRGQLLVRAGPRLWPGAFGVDRRAPWGSRLWASGAGRAVGKGRQRAGLSRLPPGALRCPQAGMLADLGFS